MWIVGYLPRISYDINIRHLTPKRILLFVSMSYEIANFLALVSERVRYHHLKTHTNWSLISVRKYRG